MKITVRKTWMTIAWKILLIVTLLGAGWWGWQQVKLQKIAMLQAQKALSDLPERVSEQAALKNELDRHQHDLQRFNTLIPTRDGIIEFISRLEQEATQRKLRVAITEDINEIAKTDENGNVIPNTDPIILVKLNSIVTGRPEDLLAFLHIVEHLPYLVRITDWELKANVTASGPSVLSVPEAQEVPDISGQLFMTLIIGRHYE